MLPKENRLKKKKDFDKVTTGGQQVFGSFLILKFKSNDMDVTRVGFVVSKKVSKKAVLRNKAKRQLREVVRAEMAHLKPGFDLIFFTRKEIIEKEFLDIQQLVKQLLQKSQLYA